MTSATNAPGPLELMATKRLALLTQCPALTEPPSDTAATFPIHVTRWGEQGPRVVLIHGGVQGGAGGGPSTWEGQAELARRGWRVERVERPGFGRSASRGVDDMERDAIWIAAMLKGGAALVGHSWGGAESLLAAALEPQAVSALILVEPALHALLPGSPEGSAPEVMSSLAQMGSALFEAQTPAQYSREFARSLGVVVGGSTTFEEETDVDTASTLGCALLRARMAAPDKFHDALRTLAEASVPVMAISGGWSPAFDAIAALVAREARGKMQIVKSPDHFPQQSAPGSFNALVDAFLRAAQIDERRHV